MVSLIFCKLSPAADLYDFDDDKDENKFDFKKIFSDNWIEPLKRERKRKYVLSVSGICTHLLINSCSQKGSASMFCQSLGSCLSCSFQCKI
ncbi:hypothetical protein ACS0TY_022383 [Phlomoides rotata]